MSFAITDKAAEKLKVMFEQNNADGLRISVVGGGCSGLSYSMKLDKATAKDKIFSNGDVKVFIDPKSYIYLSGSILEYAETLISSGFQVKNPNTKSTCGCGESFTV